MSIQSAFTPGLGGEAANDYHDSAAKCSVAISPDEKGVTLSTPFLIDDRASIPVILPASSDYHEILEILRKAETYR